MSNSKQPAPGQFYRVRENGVYEFWFDSHTLSTFSQCEQMFYLKNVMFAPQSLKLKGAQRPCVSVGSWWSRVSENFYKLMAERQDAPNILEMIGIAAKAWVEYDMDAMEQSDPDKYEKYAIPIRAGEFAKHFQMSEVPEMLEALYKIKAAKLREAGNDERARKIESLTALPLGPVVMAAQYYQTFAEQDACNWKVIAAESPFGLHGEVVVGESDKVVVYWQGKPDLVVYEHSTNVLAPLDQKTKDYIPYNVEVIWKPHNQMAGYIFALQEISKDLGYDNATIDRCILSVCGRLAPATPRKAGQQPKPRFVRVRPHYSRDEITEWRLGIMQKAERLRYCIEKESDVAFVRNEQACHLYSGCEYRPICSRPQGVRDLIIKSDYLISDPWTPFDEED